MTEKTAHQSRWPVWLMIGMLTGVIVAGFLLFPKTEEQRNRLLASIGTTNHGEFVVPPASILGLELTDTEGTLWQYKEQKTKWRMVIAGSGTCVEQCREMLYLTRQVHISLGKYSRRFERLYFAMGDKLSVETAEYIKMNHPFLTVLNTDKHSFGELLRKTNAPLKTDESVGEELMRAYLVDQKGLVMMSYTLKNKGSEMIEDIEHLMKYSPKQ